MTRPGVLRRAYCVQGLDRIVYEGPASWPQGSFRQTDAESAELTLEREGIATRPELETAKLALDEDAERFRLALAFSTGTPLTLRLVRSDEPDVDPPGVLSAHAIFSATATAEGIMRPRPIPSAMPRLPVAAARWIHTLTEVPRLRGFPDEAVKRCYLIVEELWGDFEPRATSRQQQDARELKFVRDFVSHNECKNPALCEFVGGRVPSAVIATSPPRVRFDRTNIEHVNLAGAYEPIGCSLARALIDDALTRLPP